MATISGLKVPAATLGSLFGVGIKRISQLVKGQVIPPATKSGYDLAKSVAGYVRFLREGGGSKRREELLALKIRCAEARARRMERENDIEDGQIVHVDDAAGMLEPVIVAIRAKLLALPGKLAPQTVGCASIGEVHAIAKQLTDECLVEVANINPIEEMARKKKQ